MVLEKDKCEGWITEFQTQQVNTHWWLSEERSTCEAVGMQQQSEIFTSSVLCLNQDVESDHERRS